MTAIINTNIRPCLCGAGNPQYVKNGNRTSFKCTNCGIQGPEERSYEFALQSWNAVSTIQNRLVFLEEEYGKVSIENYKLKADIKAYEMANEYLKTRLEELNSAFSRMFWPARRIRAKEGN